LCKQLNRPPAAHANLSTCADGGMRLVIYTQQALSQPEALQFCKARHGPTAGLVGGTPAVMAAAQGLVQQAQVGGRSGRAGPPPVAVLHFEGGDGQAPLSNHCNSCQTNWGAPTAARS
jgi:hypothetical protein